MRIPENIWNSPVIRQRLLLEAAYECDTHGAPQHPFYWFNVPEGDTKRGALDLRNFVPTPFHIDPHALQMDFAREIREHLQSEEHHDGLWIVGWTHQPPQYEAIRIDGDNTWCRMVMIWLDEDADPQYTLESEVPFFQMVENGTSYYVGLAAEAYEKWQEIYSSKNLIKDMELKDDQISKPALEALN